MNPLQALAEAIIELDKDDARKSRRHRIDAVVLRFAAYLESLKVKEPAA